jgi:uncharacterized peroxidase-related enzyme
MARIKLLDVAHAEQQIRATLDGIQKRLGFLPNTYRAMANHPGVFEMTMMMNKTIQAGPLDPKVRELAYLKASATNACEYCMAYHKKAGQAVGLNQAQISDIQNFEKSSAYDDRQKLVLRFAEQLTRDATVEPAVVEGLRRVFSDAELVQLSATVGVANWTNRFNHAFAIEMDHPGPR